MVSRRSSNRLKRHKRIRKKVSGTAERPRLNIYRSAKHIYCQIIDDIRGITLASASTLDKEISSLLEEKKKTEKDKPLGKIYIAKLVGDAIAKRSIQRGIKRVVFDRGGYLYHGRVKALAEAAREGGLEF